MITLSVVNFIVLVALIGVFWLAILWSQYRHYRRLIQIYRHYATTLGDLHKQKFALLEESRERLKTIYEDHAEGLVVVAKNSLAREKKLLEENQALETRVAILEDVLDGNDAEQSNFLQLVGWVPGTTIVVDGNTIEFSEDAFDDPEGGKDNVPSPSPEDESDPIPPSVFDDYIKGMGGLEDE